VSLPFVGGPLTLALSPADRREGTGGDLVSALERALSPADRREGTGGDLVLALERGAVE
jgi:hypothetical protein